MYTTTENLLLAYAIKLFNFDESKITNFLKTHSFSIDTTKWRTVYNFITDEAKKARYSDVIEYCEDVRYVKLIDTLRDKLIERDLILENRCFDNKIIEYPAHVLQWQEITPEELKLHLQSTNIVSTSPIKDVTLSVDAFKRNVIVPDHVPLISPGSREMRVIVDGCTVKHNKKYYLRMNEQDREFDDFIDKIEDFYYYKDDLRLKNRELKISELFPAAGKIKNLEERRELYNRSFTLEVEMKNESEDVPASKKVRRMGNFDRQLKNITDKVNGKKAGEKDKNLWSGELNLIIKAVSELSDQRTGGKIAGFQQLKDINGQVTENSSLGQSVLKVLMIMQELMFKLKDDEIFERLFEYKKIIISFYDYYRK